MPIRPFNYAALPPANMGQVDLAGSFMKGVQAGAMPKNIKQKQQQQGDPEPQGVQALQGKGEGYCDQCTDGAGCKRGKTRAKTKSHKTTWRTKGHLPQRQAIRGHAFCPKCSKPV